MLAFKFDMTPAQVDFLLIVFSGRYKQLDKSPHFLPDCNSPHFVGIAGKLINRGLLTHDNSRNPTYLITDNGRAVAQMIVDDARRIAANRYVEVTPAARDTLPKFSKAAKGKVRK